MRAKVRLYVDVPLGGGQVAGLTRGQAHYLFAVMRLGVGEFIAIFNGRDGEWTAEIAEAGKRAGTVICREAAAPQAAAPDLWLMFAPVKKARTDFIVEKATEIGVSRLLPVFTEYTDVGRVRAERLRANAVEAAEQSGATLVPEVAEPVKLGPLLDGFPADRRLMFCDERSRTQGAAAALEAAGPGPWAILVGPEGGFSQAEADRLRRFSRAVPVSLGPRVLRAETAAVAALTLWHATLGDWR
ncbi:MAG: 16S rRNA (uracil(1498)-N(3))-methyltransferase [Paracoccaceae bacterium]